MAASGIASAARAGKSAFNRADQQTASAVASLVDEIEAAGLKLMRIRSIGGGAQFFGKRMRKAA